jgi:hypothetical protein
VSVEGCDDSGCGPGRARLLAALREVWAASEAAKLLASRHGDPLRIEDASNPADPDSDLYETGALLPGPDATLAGPTFEEWLDSTP